MSTSTPEKQVDSLWCRDYRDHQYTYAEAVDLIREFHGHVAPGLVIGTKMVAMAMDRIPRGVLFDAVCETTSCLPDAVQMLTPCTIGNGWMQIQNLGRYAVTLYDKFKGDGVRVFIDSAKLEKWPEFYAWFYKTKEKKDQDFDLLMSQIRDAGQDALGVSVVQVKPSYLVHRSKGAIATCPLCREAYPVSHGSICRGCQGDAPCEPSPAETGRGPVLKMVPVEQAEGRRALHDMTRIEPGVSKGPAISSGETIQAVDICRLQKMGRQRIFVEDDADLGENWVHENRAAVAFARGLAGDGVAFQDKPREGKVNLQAGQDGLLTVETGRLEAFNTVPGVMCASRPSFSMVKKDEEIAGTRAIPLYLSREDYQTAMAVLENGPVFQVLPIRPARVGILVTGTEVFQGLVKDSFIPIIRKKVETYGCTVSGGIIVPDERAAIAEGVRSLLDQDTEILVTTAGLSVDPDDVTRPALVDAGCREILYGAPILPGAMTLLGRIGKVRVIGVPACALFHNVTSFDLLLPRLLADVPITRRDLARMGHGAFCRNCNKCTYPKCRFGR